MQQSHENELATSSIGALLFKLSVPAITAQIINLLYNIVDRIYIGHIPEVGFTALTGVGVTMPLIIIISAFACLVSMGAAPMASIMMGKGDKETAEKILGNSTTTLIIVSIILTAIILIFGEKMLMLFGASENTIGYALDYMNIYAYGTLLVQLSLGLNAFISAQGHAKVSMMSVLIGAVLNIILDPIFIFVFGMGVKGAALATIISQGVSAIWVFRFLISKKSDWNIKVEHLKINFKIFLPCIALGLSPFIMQATESIIMIVFNSSLQKYGGDLAVGAMTICGSIMQFSLLPLVGLTQGAQPIISFNYGAGNIDRVKKTVVLSIKTAVIYSFSFWLLVQLFPGKFALLFIKDDLLLMEATIRALRVYMGATLIIGAQIACQQSLIALGNAKTSVFLALLRKMFLLLPLIYIIPLFMNDKVMGVFLSEPIADFIAVIVTVSLFTIKFKKLIKEHELA